MRPVATILDDEGQMSHSLQVGSIHIGEGNGNLHQCSCLENPRDGGAWQAAVLGSHRVWHD